MAYDAQRHLWPAHGTPLHPGGLGRRLYVLTELHIDYPRILQLLVGFRLVAYVDGGHGHA